MVFDIREKSAIITGGASGIGKIFAQVLLSNGAKGVTIADINEIDGENWSKELNLKFGCNKAIFIKTDITKYGEFEGAFKATLEKFGHIDILVNNAGVALDGKWRKQVDVNIVGTLNGMILGMDHYLPKYKSGDEAVILVTSSVCGLEGYPKWPIYTTTKFAITGMVLSWGSEIHYDRTKVRVIAICPSATNTDMLKWNSNTYLSPEYKEINYLEEELQNKQEPEHVANEMIKLLKDSKTGSFWVVENGAPSYEFVFPTRQNLGEKI